MTSVEAALAAMDTAEQEAREWMYLLGDEHTRYTPWARDRLRLIQRDRGTLQRHHARQGRYFVGAAEGWQAYDYCVACKERNGHPRNWLTCPDARAVIDHWTEDA